MYKVLFFGAIGTLVETSDMERLAFNAAFDDAGLDWHWDHDAYQGLLHKSDGAARIADYATEQDQQVDVAAIHAAKERIFIDMMRENGLTLRAGIRDLINAAKTADMTIGFVTAISKDQSDAIFAALGDDLTQDEFAYIGDASRVKNPKPAPDIYHDALTSLDMQPTDALAIEDTANNADAAIAAGITTIGFAGDMVGDQQFPAGVRMVDALTPNLLTD